MNNLKNIDFDVVFQLSKNVIKHKWQTASPNSKTLFTLSTHIVLCLSFLFRKPLENSLHFNRILFFNILFNIRRSSLIYVFRRACVRRGGNCDHRPNECCYNSSCRCNLWGSNCRCQRMGLFQKWG